MSVSWEQSGVGIAPRFILCPDFGDDGALGQGIAAGNSATDGLQFIAGVGNGYCTAPICEAALVS